MGNSGDRPCPVDGCPLPVSHGDYCVGHYMKWWRYGTPTPVHKSTYVDLVGQRFGHLVVLERAPGSKWLCQCDCGAQTTSRAYNLTHGMKSSCGAKFHVWDREVGYSGPHKRCNGRWGSARQYPCVECGQTAAHWAYDHADPTETWVELDGARLVISRWEEFYKPMCVRCHKRLDMKEAQGGQLR